MRFRRSELIFSAYFLYAMGVAAVRPIAPETRLLILTLNPALMGWFCLFAWAHRGRGFIVLDHVRDWYPVRRCCCWPFAKWAGWRCRIPPPRLRITGSDSTARCSGPGGCAR